MTIDGSKFYGPRRSGILYVHHGVKIDPIFYGGGQEGGLRSGTEDSASSMALSEALLIATENMKKESERVGKLRDYMEERVLSLMSRALIHASQILQLNALPSSDSF